MSLVNPYRFATGGDDPYWSSVVFLAQCDEGAGNPVVDTSDSAHTITLNNGLALVSGTAPSWQSSSLSFDNSNDYAAVADSADWSFGSGDFTIEYFLHRDSAQVDAVIAQWSGAGNKNFAIFENSRIDNGLEFYYSADGSAATGITATMSGNLNVWSHRAVSRVGGNIYLCQGGTILSVTAITGGLYNSTLSLVIGSNNGASAFLGAQMANIRITKGVGRYSGTALSSYTVPTAPYPES